MEKFLGEVGLKRLRDNLGRRFVQKDAGERMVETVTDENYNETTVRRKFLPDEIMKCPVYDGTPYKMADLYPDSYDVMGSVPDTAGFSSLPIVDGLYKGCAGLMTLPDTTFKNGVSAVEFAKGCTYLENASWVVLPAQDIQHAFFGCENLQEPPEIDWPRVSNAYGCFWGCTRLAEVFPQIVDLSGMSDKGGWRGMFAESGVRLVYVRGYDLLVEDYEPFTGTENILLYYAWAKWCEGEGVENDGTTTITFDMPNAGYTGNTTINGTVYFISEGTYTVVAPTTLFENYAQYRKDNKALFLSWEMTIGDQFYADVDIQNSVNTVALDANELAVAQNAKYRTYLNDISRSVGADGFTSIASANKKIFHVDLQNPEYASNNEDPVYARNFARTLAAGNTHGMPWHEIRFESTSTYTSNGEIKYKICPGDTVTFYVKHHNDQTMKLAVRLI